MRDLRFAVRQLAKSKGFTVTAVLTVALAIGANTAIFTLVNAVMFQSLPVSDPRQLYRLGDADNCCVDGGIQTRFSIFAYPLYLYLRDHTPEFQDMAAFQAGPARVGVHRGSTGSHANGTAAEPFVDQFVSGKYFSMFGIRPFAGRLLTASDDVRGAPPVAVMSYRAWALQYGSDPSVIGASFLIGGAPFTIAGIAPPGFFGATLRPDPPDFWLPLAAEREVHRQNALLDHKTDHWLYIIGRIRPGAALGPVEAEINVLLKQWLRENDPPTTPASKQAFDGQHVTLAPAGSGIQQLKENYGSDLKLLAAVTGLVLLIACANLANLLLARGAANRAQASIRVALGAPRSRLVRQTLTEAVVLAVAGGAAGVLLAMAGTKALLNLAFSAARFVPISSAPSLPVLGFSFLLSLATGVVFGIVPAWSASRADPAAALRGAGRSTSGGATFTQKLLVALQVALSLVLLAGAGLMVQTLGNLQNQRFGFELEGRAVVNVNAAFGGYSPEKLAAVYGEIERRMKALGGVRAASLSLYSPMEGNNWNSRIWLADQAADANPQSVSWVRVSSSFFETIGARIVHGRMFDERDTPDAAHVTVVNQAFVDKFLPNQDPVGKRFGMGGAPHRGDYQIAGVVENVRFRNPRSPAAPMYFLPLLQLSKSDWSDPTLARSTVIGNIELRMAGNAKPQAAQIVRALGEIDPNLTVININTMQDQLGRLLGHERLIARLTEGFGLLALVLASIGLYGVTAHSVAGRTGEIGVRMALGATRATVTGMILRSVFGQIACGVAIGVPAALAAGRILADQLFGVGSADPMTLAAVVGALSVSALVAGLLPALRASGIDPVQALRAE
ncbi:MAG TPA: ABC transporter permease [Candidatus Acidoferrales bacterium]|nr:ABC transporter permease [Candidatus Acidoferrales bacterium]